MKLKLILIVLTTLLALGGCGASGGDGVNGQVALVSATADGPWITALAKYVSPDKGNVIGTKISFYVQLDDTTYFITERSVDSVTGEVGALFKVPAFNGAKQIIVIAKSDKLEDSELVDVIGRSMSLTPPSAITQSTTAATGTNVDITIPSNSFITITDPFSTAEHTVTITAEVTSTSGSATITPTSTTTTWSGGTLLSPATVVHLTVPAVLTTETATITWTVTDQTSSLVRTGTTVVSLTKPS
ncbi:hypothetical protein M1B72_07655 [Geomonas paludis]|uniref:Lipoprotein n=1 Tax=Geomonas paludis TaxID=2740185 RepID=A0A6V8MVY7_9BACT|nr:hypothetical protein [Geomonas paludis]UPU37572.1 hypothetical protein M1B72_07655 [Geomonas paludis]GFO63897.1 hypothetical protein GMPD_18160 [Geomonas paludis]